MNTWRPLSFLPLLAMAHAATAADVAVPAAVPGTPIGIALPSAFATLVWAPLLLVFVLCAVSLVVLIARQGRKSPTVSRKPVAKAAARRTERVPTLVRT